jgi:hypothetical protein
MVVRQYKRLTFNRCVDIAVIAALHTVSCKRRRLSNYQVRGVKKGVQLMKRTSGISGTGSNSAQVETVPPRPRSVFISLLILGASFLVLAALTAGFYRGYIATGRYSLGLLACLSSVLATAVLLGAIVLLSLRLRARRRLPPPTAALISALQRDPDPRVRAKAAEGLAELELEQAPHSDTSSEDEL